MSKLVKYWAGHIYGTNIGPIFLNLQNEAEDGSLSGYLHVNDKTAGVVTKYNLSGKYGETIQLKGSPDEKLERELGVNVGFLSAEAKLTPEGNLQGTWHTSINTAGTFILYPHGDSVLELSIPEENNQNPHNKTLQLGVISLKLDELKQILYVMQKDYPKSQLIITSEQSGTWSSVDSNEFLKNRSGIDHLNSIGLFIKEKEVGQKERSVAITLRPGGNTISVTGLEKEKVTYEANILESLFKKHESFLSTIYKKYGSYVSFVIFLVTLSVIPSLDSITKRLLPDFRTFNPR